MPSLRFVLGGLRPSIAFFLALLTLATVSRAPAATVGSGDGPGEKVYQEDFADPSAVDIGAGATPGFDQTSIEVGSLVQIRDAGGTVVTPFDVASDYTYDGSKIEVVGGVARLRPDPLWPSVVAAWSFEEATWTGSAGEVVDVSPSGLDGTALGQAQVVANGLHGSAASFDGADDAVLIGQPASPALGPTDDYTLSAWFRTTGDGALIAKADANFGQRELYLFVAGGGLWGAVGGSQNQGPATGVSDGQWHHGVLVNRDSGGSMGYTLYLDGQPNGSFSSGTATNGSDLLLGARRDSGNSGLAFELVGELDEVMIFDRALSAAEVASLWADGLGRVVREVPSDGPTVHRTAGTSLFNASGLSGFDATPGAASQGALGFQLSSDGATWQHWNGSDWVPATAGETTDAITVDANIAAFDLSAGALFVRTALLGDGSEPVEIDQLQFDFSRAPVFEAREVLGPIHAGDRFEALIAEISGEDASHSVRLRVLESDATTPVDEATLPGNLLGFDSTQLVGDGVDLSALGAGDLYLEVIFDNLLGDGDTARLDRVEVVYLDPLPVADVGLEITDSIDPLELGTTYFYEYRLTVTNHGPNEAVNVSLSGELPPELSHRIVHRPAFWSCVSGALDCTTASMAPGTNVDFVYEVQTQVFPSSTLQIFYPVTVTAQNDSNPANDTFVERTTLDPEVITQFRAEHDASPADGTDFIYDLITRTGPLTRVLDDAFPDDDDGVLRSISFSGVGATVYQATQRPNDGWLLDGIECTSPQVDVAFHEGYSDAAAYAYDPSALTVEGGVAQLIEDPVAPDVVASWRFEEAGWNGTAGEVAGGGSGLDGTALGDATTVASGQLGRGATFDGGGDAVLLGQPTALDLDPGAPFTLSAWFRTSGDGALIAKADSDFGNRQFYLFVAGGSLWGAVGGSQSQGLSGGVSDGAWHHAALVNQDDGGVMRYTLYLDGVADGTFDSGTATNGLDVLLGARRNSGNSGLAFELDGELDEVAVIGRALTASEIGGLWAGGAGRVLGGYPSHGPALAPLAPLVDTGLIALTGFVEEPGPEHEGGLAYQLSTDGSSWLWFDGLAWVPAGSGEHNDAATVDGAIAQFPAIDSLWVRAFLLSDGSQRSELDRVKVLYQADGLGGLTISGATVTADVSRSPDADCTFDTIVDPSSFGSLTLVQSSIPADGTDFDYIVDLGLQGAVFALDDGGAADGVDSQRSWTGLDPGVVTITQTVREPRWYLSDIQCVNGSSLVSTLDYDDPGAYAYDPAKIEISGGVAKLGQDPFFADLLGYWRMDEAGWGAGTTFDDSGNGLDGTVLGSANTVSGGLIGRAGDFDGQGDGVTLGQPASLDFAPGSDAFTVSAWFRTRGDGALVGKAEDSFGQRQVYLFLAGGQVHSNVGGVQNAGSGSGYADGLWHHVALVNEDAGGTMRHRLWVDGALEGDFASGNATNGADWMIGARRRPGNVGIGFELDGELDEVAIFGRALDGGELAELYADGSGRALGAYPSDAPSVAPLAGTPVGGPLTGFVAVLAAGDSSNLGFQLSSDGTSWQFWNGGAWVLAGDDGQRNDAATVHQNAASFDVSSGAVWVRVFLLSDGSQPVALERLELSSNGGGAITTQVELFSGVATIDLQGGQDITCTFVNRLDELANSTLTIEIEADPADGTDFETTVNPAGEPSWTFFLDDASPDDGDGYSNSWTASNQPVGSYFVTSVLPEDWNRTAIECVDESASGALVAPFETAADYLYDPADVAVEGGLARLAEDPVWTDLLAYWRFEEGTWDETPGEVLDTSGQGHHGTSGGYPTGFNALVEGKIGDAGDFYLSGGHVSFGSPAALDLQPGSDAFTVSAWFRTTAGGAIVGKAGGTLEQRQFYLFVLDDKLWSIVGGQVNSGTTLGVTDDDWHLATLVNYDSGGGAMRHALYLDGRLEGDFPSGSAANTADVLVGARRADDSGGGVAFQFDGLIDEVLIADRALTPGEIDELYSFRAGRIVTQYPTGTVGETIERVFDDPGSIDRFLGFDATLGAGNVGQVGYQIDPGDGSFYFWEIDHWRVTPNLALYSTAATLNQHVGLLTPGPGPVRLRALLLSDGTEPVELDSMRLDYGLAAPFPFTQWGASLEVDLGLDQAVRCTLHNEKSAQGQITLRVESEPSDGTDFEFERGVANVLHLDDAQPDDGDAVPNSVTFESQIDTTFYFQALGASQWAVRSVDCQGGSQAFDYESEGRNLSVPVLLGENVVCTVRFERWFERTSTAVALTQTTTGALEGMATGDQGEHLLVAAAADLDGTNGGLDRHVFLYRPASGTWDRLTTSSELYGLPDVSSNGRWGVVPWDGEVLRFDLELGTSSVVTTSQGCRHLDPVINDDGTKVAFSGDCFTNPDGYFKVALSDDGVPHPIADATGCFSLAPRISNDPAGEKVTFPSKCDWAGTNFDGGLEIFQWRWQEGAAVVDQLTDVDTDAGFYSSSLQTSREGRYVFVATNRSTGNPASPFDDVARRIDTTTGEVLDFWDAGQGLIDPQPIVGLYDEPYLPMAPDGSGQHVVFLGLRTDDPTATPRWFWAEVTEAGDVIYNELAVGDVPSTDLVNLAGRVQLAVPANGLPVIYLISDSDFDGTNPDGNQEIWQITFE